MKVKSIFIRHSEFISESKPLGPVHRTPSEKRVSRQPDPPFGVIQDDK